MSAVPVAHGDTRVQIRPATEVDLPRILVIEAASYDYPWSQGNFADSLKSGYGVWLREVEGEVTAYYVVMTGAGEAHLLNLTVAPAWRRRGIGREMLDDCLRRACEAAAHIVLLEVRTSNTGAIALYHQSGFSDLAVRRGYYPAAQGREDALIMSRTLSC